MTTTFDKLSVEPGDLEAPAVSTQRASQWMRARPGLFAFLTYALISLLADLPIWPGDPNQVPTVLGGDIVQTAWFLEWTPWAILHGHNPFFSNAINFPAGVDLAQNTGMQLLAVLTAPLTLFVSPIASENLLRFLAFTLSAYSCFWVLRRWSGFVPAAFVGGLLYGFSPYMVTQGEYHLNLIFVPFPPLILYALFEILIAQEHSPRRWGLLLGGFAVCQFFVSAEVLATTALVAGLGGFYLFFLGIRYVPAKFPHALVGLFYAAIVIAPLLSFPVYEMLRGRAHYVGPAQGFHNVYNADLLGPFVPTKDQLVAPARLSEIGTSLVGAQLQENGSYLGIPLIAAVVYLVTRYWRRLWPLFLALMALSVFVFSLGPVLVLDGKAHHLPVDLPFAKIDHLPIIENILPVRLSLYVVFFVAVILTLGLSALHEDFVARHAAPAADSRHGRHLLVEIGSIGVAALALVAVIPRWPYKTTAVSLGVHYAESARGLRMVPTGATVLAYPYPTSFFDMAMLWQSLDDMRFNLIGSYALVPNKAGEATLFPTILQPEDVEAMLVNSVTEVADPDLPDLVATASSLDASKIVLLSSPRTPHEGATLVGRIGEVDRATSTFYLYPNHYNPVEVRFGPTTSFLGPGGGVLSPADLVFNRRIAVYGKVGPGTVTPAMVRSLRTFLRVNKVDTVIIGLGITDANEVARWFRAAIGRATRAGGGGEIWNHVPTKLERPPGTLSAT